MSPGKRKVSCRFNDANIILESRRERVFRERHTRFVPLEKYLFDRDGETSPDLCDRRPVSRGRVCARISGPFWVSPPTRSLNPLEATSEREGFGSPRMTLGTRYNVERTNIPTLRSAFVGCFWGATDIAGKNALASACLYVSLVSFVHMCTRLQYMQTYIHTYEGVIPIS